jgi:hypothetical protein
MMCGGGRQFALVRLPVGKGVGEDGYYLINALGPLEGFGPLLLPFHFA